MNGWIKLHRKLLASNTFQNEKLLKVFIYCLLKATHTEHQQLVGKQTVDLKPGQFVFGRKKAALELDMKESTVRDYINVLKKDNVIAISPTNKFSVITIANWEIYQSKDDDNRQQNDSKMTAERQQNDTNKNVNNVNKNKEEEDALVLFDKNIARLSEHVKQQLLSWIDDMSEEIVSAAVKLAAEHGATSYAYVNKILIDWHKNNLQDIDQVRNYEIRKRQANKTIPFKRKKTVGEINWEGFDVSD